MPKDESDLSFAEFDAPKAPLTAPGIQPFDDESSNYLNSLARREGFEPPTLRFEA